MEIDSAELENIDMTEVQNDKESLTKLIDQYKNAILERCELERKNYLDYLKSIHIDADTALVDSQLYGTIQYYLGHLLGCRLTGYYMCCKLDETNEYLPYNKMYGCFQPENDLSANGCAVKEYGDFVESFYTAPNGMALYMDAEGKPVYGQPMSNQKYFDVRFRMNEGVKAFISDMIEVCNRNQMDPFEVRDALFADDLLRCYAKEGFEPTNAMKEGFYYDNAVSNRLESPIWG
jgi:hypothetical protein